MCSMIKSAVIDDVKEGMKVQYTQSITDSDVSRFSEISGDKNPVHLDDDYAKASPFKKRIAHGLLSASFFSGMFGMKLPGPGCVYVSQSLRFIRPVYIGDTVTATATVTRVDYFKRRVFFETICTVDEKIVIAGEAEIYIPRTKTVQS